MDPIIHSLLGITVAEAAGASGPYEAALVTAAAGGAVVADVDFVLRPFGSTMMVRFHHGPSHSFPGGLVLSALWAAAITYVPQIILSWWTPPFFL